MGKDKIKVYKILWRKKKDLNKHLKCLTFSMILWNKIVLKKSIKKRVTFQRFCYKKIDSI